MTVSAFGSFRKVLHGDLKNQKCGICQYVYILTRNYHSSINNLTIALWSDINTRLNNLSTTTNFILDIIFFFIKLVNSLFHVNTDIFRINNDPLS